MLHGFPQSSRCWRGVIGALAERFRVITPDLRGYGESDKPPRVMDYRDEALRADIVGLIKEEGAERAHIVGHDWGGGIAYSLALNDPERVDKLVVLNCPHPQAFLYALRTDWRQAFRSWYVWFFQLPWLPERLLRLGAPWLIGGAFRGARRPGAFTEEDVAAYVENIRRPGAARAGINYYRAAVSLRELRARRGPPKMIAAPTLILWGEDDPYLGLSLVEGSEKYFSGPIRIERLPACGHWVPEEQPERVVRELLAFLPG